jgi:hypothetical protein
MAGFQLMFNSNRPDQPATLYSAMSKRVERRYDYSKMPTGTWMSDNILWLLGLGAAFVAFLFGTWFALRKPSSGGTDTNPRPAKAAV